MSSHFRLHQPDEKFDLQGELDRHPPQAIVFLRGGGIVPHHCALMDEDGQ